MENKLEKSMLIILGFIIITTLLVNISLVNAQDGGFILYLPVILNGDVPTPTPTSTPTPTITPTPTKTPTPRPISHPILPGYNYSCTCYYNDNPLLCATVNRAEADSLRGDNVTVSGRHILFGQPVSNEQMSMTWFFYDTIKTCSGTTNSSGIASCTMKTPWVGNHNYTVRIRISIDGVSVQTYFLSTYINFLTMLPMRDKVMI